MAGERRVVLIAHFHRPSVARPAWDVIPILLDGLVAYRAAPAGIIPWKQRPQIFKSGVVARLPPIDTTGAKS